MVWLVSRSRSLLIRRWGWMYWKLIKKNPWTARARTYHPDLSRWLPLRFTRVRHVSSTPLLALYANCRGVHPIGQRGNQLLTHHPLHTLCQNRCQSYRPKIVHLFHHLRISHTFDNPCLALMPRNFVRNDFCQECDDFMHTIHNYFISSAIGHERHCW